jgi:hypothetical protein
MLVIFYNHLKFGKVFEVIFISHDYTVYKNGAGICSFQITPIITNLNSVLKYTKNHKKIKAFSTNMFQYS